MEENPIKIDDAQILSALGLKFELRVVAPYLWDRENIRRGIDDQIVKCATTETKYFRITEDSMVQIPNLLSHTVNFLKHNIVCDDAFVYLVDKARNNIVLEPCSRNASVDVLLSIISHPIELLQSVAGHVAFTKDSVLSNDLRSDNRFRYDAGIDVKDDIRSTICVPVLVRNFECYAVIELNRYQNQEFVQRDLDTLTVVSGWVGSTVEQHQKRLKIKRSEEIECEVSKILQSFISLQADFDQSLHNVLEVAKDAIGAENASFYLFDHSISSSHSENAQMFTYDPAIVDMSANIIVLKKNRTNIEGLVKLTIESDNCINISDFATDARVNPKLDCKMSLKMRSLLFIPIMDPSGCLLGVMQMINKVVDDETAFSSQDEITLQSFCACLVNMLKFQLQVDLQSRAVCYNALSEDVMVRRIPMHIVLSPTVPPAVLEGVTWPENFTSYQWHPNVLKSQHEMIDLCYKMLTTVCNQSTFEPHTMYIFLITIKEMHRKHPFHNFEKSFSSMQGVFCILSRVKDKFDPIEKLSMMIASLCVGLDHSGLSNAFLRLSNNPLSKIYSESYNENHIVWMTKMLIANTRVLHLLSSEQLETFDGYFHDQILCTDLHAFALGRNLKADSFRDRPIDWSSGEDHQIMRNLITMCTYLPHLYKTFPLSRTLLGNYIQQMWSEGDMVRDFGIRPTPYYDRACNQTAKINLDMLRIVGVPCFKALSAFIPETDGMYANCRKVIAAWEQTLEHSGKRMWFPDKSIN